MIKLDLPARVKKGLHKKSLIVPGIIRKEISAEKEGQARTRYATKQILDEINIKDRTKRQAVQKAVTQHFKEAILIEAEKERMSYEQRLEAKYKVDDKLTASLKQILGKDFDKFEQIIERVRRTGE